MTTARDLMIIALDVEASPAVHGGDLSLALAGAELIDLLQSPTIRLDGGRIVPGYLSVPADRLLEEARAALVMEEPHELVSDWLWRRGERLAVKYASGLEGEGLIANQRGRFFRSSKIVVVESPSRRQAAARWAAAEPVLLTLASAIGIPNDLNAGDDAVTDYAVTTVLAAVGDAVLELAVERQRTTIEQQAFGNTWRSPE